MNEIGNRKQFHWSGQDRGEDMARLAVTIAGSGAGLCRQGDRIMQLDSKGQLNPVNMAAFREIIDKHICAVRIVNRGQGWQREFYSYRFAPARGHDPSLSGPQPPPDTSEPDDKVLEEIYRTELLLRLPRVE